MLSDNIWWTRQSRIRTEHRLLSNAFHSQVILLWYSFYSVAISIYYLGRDASELSSKYWLIYSVLVLVVSVYINGFSYKERAGLIKENYEYLKSLFGTAKDIERANGDLSDVHAKYEKALNSCENHHPSDYLEALYDVYQSAQDKDKVSPHPTEYQIKKAKKYKRQRTILLSFFYLLPVVISLALISEVIIEGVDLNWWCQQ